MPSDATALTSIAPSSMTRAHSVQLGADAALFAQVATLISQIGLAAFDTALADLLKTAAVFQQCAIFTVPRCGEPHHDAMCLYSWHRAQPAVARALVRRYVEGRFDRVDPILRDMQHAMPPRTQMRLLNRDDIDDIEYRRHFFETPGLGNKLSVLSTPNRSGFYLNFYKSHADNSFSDQEINRLLALTGIVESSIRQHQTATSRRQQSLPALDELRRLIAALSTKLTGRELDVCARIVSGYSSEATALDLGIATSSVATYRKRAYARLGISSQNELFARCLAGLSPSKWTDAPTLLS